MYRLKVVDVLIHCNTRYDSLYDLKSRIRAYGYTLDTNGLPAIGDSRKRQENEEIEDYYRRYWALQADQLDYFQKGVIDIEDLVYWSYTKRREFQHAHSGNGLGYREAWINIGFWHNRENKLFIWFIHQIMLSVDNGRSMPPEQVREWLEPLRGRIWTPRLFMIRVKRKILSRMTEPTKQTEPYKSSWGAKIANSNGDVGA